jgi:hypothetical protein
MMQGGGCDWSRNYWEPTGQVVDPVSVAQSLAMSSSVTVSSSGCCVGSLPANAL